MDNLTKEQSTAVTAYKKADAGKKKLLESIFGKTLFAPKTENEMEKIKSFADACKRLKINSKKALPYPKPKDEEEEALNAVRMLWIIVKALRGDWLPDYGNSDQKKWWGWFQWQPGAGFVFDYSYTYYDGTGTVSGSRLCLPTKEMSDYFNSHFIDLHRKVLQYESAT